MCVLFTAVGFAFGAKKKNQMEKAGLNNRTLLKFHLHLVFTPEEKL